MSMYILDMQYQRQGYLRVIMIRNRERRFGGGGQKGQGVSRILPQVLLGEVGVEQYRLRNYLRITSRYNCLPPQITSHVGSTVPDVRNKESTKMNMKMRKCHTGQMIYYHEAFLFLKPWSEEKGNIKKSHDAKHWRWCGRNNLWTRGQQGNQIRENDDCGSQ